jgi:hypothetical protein
MANTFNIGDRVRIEHPVDPGYHNKLGTVTGPGHPRTGTTTASVRFDEDIPNYPAGKICRQFDTRFLVLEYHVIHEDDDELETADV